MRHFSKKPDKSFYEDLKSYIQSFTEMKSEARSIDFEEIFDAIGSCNEAPACLSSMQAPRAAGAHRIEKRAEIFIPEKEPSFCDKLFEIIDKKGLKDSRVYNKADIDRRLFSKIRSDTEYHPSKNTAIRLCLALELNIAETEDILERAGYCLSLSDTTDLVIRYCIEHKIYDIISVNEAIDYFSGKLI